MRNLPDDEESAEVKKRNRIKKLSPKTHKISHESGRATKSLWAQIIERARRK